jgi:hypothetical protein
LAQSEEKVVLGLSTCLFRHSVMFEIFKVPSGSHFFPVI